MELTNDISTCVVRPLQSKYIDHDNRSYEVEYYSESQLDNIDVIISGAPLLEDGSVYLIDAETKTNKVINALNLSPFFFHDGTLGTFPGMFAGYARGTDTLRYVYPESANTTDFMENVVGFRKALLEIGGKQSSSSAPKPRGNMEGLRGFENIQGIVDFSAPMPNRFYSGHIPLWSDLAANLDVRRSVLYRGDRISYSQLIHLIESDDTYSNVFMLFAEAGSGKSTALRRLEYDLFNRGQVVFRKYQNMPLDIDGLITELRELPLAKRFLFIDDAQYFTTPISILSAELKQISPETKLICAARKNEWNEKIVTKNLPDYEEILLPNLSDNEFNVLLLHLQDTNTLGRLDGLSQVEQHEILAGQQQKQLLVLLLEATRGKRFSEIVLDEYINIQSELAKFLYLSLCLASKLGLGITQDIVQLITFSKSQIELKSTVTPSLELVINRVSTPNGIEWQPRHRVIADELASRICPENREKLSIWKEVLKRLSKIDAVHKEAQYLSANLVKRLLSIGLIESVADSDEIEDLLLNAGVGETWSYGSHEKNRSTIHPNQFQFQVAVELRKKFQGDDKAIELIYEGLVLQRKVQEAW